MDDKASYINLITSFSLSFSKEFQVKPNAAIPNKSKVGKEYFKFCLMNNKRMKEYMASKLHKS